MSFPNIPDVTASISINREQAVNLILASIAFEELGLSHIINAEAEKLQYVLGTLNTDDSKITSATPKPTISDLISVNNSVEKTLKSVIKNQMLLEFKLDEASNLAIDPSISMKKFVSVDEGITWVDAQAAPGPTLYSPTNPKFKFFVTNTGNVKLTGVSVNDSVLGPISIGGVLEPGQSFVATRDGTFESGQQMNTATVHGSYQSQQVQDSDIAYFFGAENEEICD